MLPLFTKGAMREQLEIVYSRVVLKPIEVWLATRNSQALSKSQPAKIEVVETDDNLLSEQACLDDLKLDNIDTLQIGIHANFVLETLLSLTPEQIAHFFLVYDCQPFCESLITKSLQIVIKFNQHDLGKTLTVISAITNSFSKMNFDFSQDQKCLLGV